MPKKSITTFEELATKLKGDVKFQKSYRKKKPYYDILNEIFKRRKELGITQEELADKAGFPQSSIARLESGEHNIKLSTLIQIAEALDSKVEIRLYPIYTYNEEDYIKLFDGSTLRTNLPDYLESETSNEENEIFDIGV